MDRSRKLKLLSLASILGICLFLIIGLTPANTAYFLSLRIPKVLAILIVSYCIGYSSIIFQTITGNKVLTPSVMGLDSLYLFVQTCIVFFSTQSKIQPLKGEMNFFLSVGVMMLFSLILYQLLFKGTQKNIYFMLLSGMILGMLFDGLASFMQVLLDPNEFLILQGTMFANFSSIHTNLLLPSAIVCILVFLCSIKNFNELDVLSLGVNHAINLGIGYKKIILKNLVITSVLIAISTALVGPITFLGILVVSLSRKIFQIFQHKYLACSSVLLSFVFLIYGLFVVEHFFNLETTLSVVINFIGGIYFIFFIIQEGKQ